MTSDPRPPFDPEASAILDAIHEFMPLVITPDLIPVLRTPPPGVPTNLELALQAYPGVAHRDVRIAGYQGDEITVAVFEPADGVKSGAGILWLHGGGMIIGDRFLGAKQIAAWADEFDAVVVSVEYRLAPEHAYPTLTEDAYAGLVWFAEHAPELGVDPANIVVAGSSAGGNLATAVSLLARDRKGPAIKGALLQYPMLEDREPTGSALEYAEVGFWTGGSNDTAWKLFLGDLERGSSEVPVYAAPARETDLEGFPPSYLDVGESELFRDEVVAFATRLWAAGTSAELHVTPGIWHAFEDFAPDHPTADVIQGRRTAWLRKTLGA